MPTDEMESEIKEPESPGWSRALRESHDVCPDLTARVLGRMVRDRIWRRGSLVAAALLAGVVVAWMWSPSDSKPMLAIEQPPAKTLPTPAPREMETLAIPSPVARMIILDDQQAALWAGLEKLTEDL